MQVTPVRTDEPVPNSSPVLRRLIAGKSNGISVGRPDRNSDDHAGVFFVRDLARLAGHQLLHPKVAMASVIGEVGHFAVLRIQGWSLDLAGLMSDAHPPAHVLCGIAANGEFPNVVLHVLAADYDSSTLVHIGVLISSFAECQLLRSAA